MKLEQAARQALEALIEANVVAERYQNADKRKEAITALREALAEPQVDWQEEALRLGGLNAKHVGELRKLEAEQAEQEPVAWWFQPPNKNVRPMFDTQQHGGKWKPLYAAPVRTKDLTDDEIDGIAGFKRGKGMTDFARAVITKFKEKNK